MTGVVVALGGRAAQTSRGLTLKNFVKKGCRYVSISVILWQSLASGWRYRVEFFLLQYTISFPLTFFFTVLNCASVVCLHIIAKHMNSTVLAYIHSHCLNDCLPFSFLLYFLFTLPHKVPSITLSSHHPLCV